MAQCTDANKHIHSILDVIDPLVVKEFESTKYDDLTITSVYYPVVREQAKIIREQALNKNLIKSVLSSILSPVLSSVVFL